MSTFSGGPNIVTDGLVMYLDAANTKSYVSGSTTWNDISRSGFNGTLTNGPTFDSSNGGSMVFDGADDYISVTNPLFSLYSGSNNSQQVWSVSTWANVSNNNVVQPLVSGINNGLHLNWATTNKPLLYNNSGLSNDYYRYGTINQIVGKGWVNVVYLFRNSDGYMRIFINGVDRSDNSINLSSTPLGLNATIIIGSYSIYRLNGKIANINIYNRVLSSSEILQNYNATRGRFGV